MAELREKLLAVHPADCPFGVRDGAEEGVDLIAGLRLVDPTWNELFREVNLRRVYTIKIKLDEAKREVRTKGKVQSIRWRDGQPRFVRFGGEDDQTHFGEPSMSIKAASYRRVKWLKFEKLKEFKYRTDDLREPLERVVIRSGWTWRSKVIGRL